LQEGGQGQADRERRIKFFQKSADKGVETARDLIRAIALAKPTAEPTPFAPGVSTAPNTLPKDATIEQQVKAAYTAKQVASALVQKADKAVVAKDGARQKTKQCIADWEQKLASARDQLVQQNDEHSEAQDTLQEAMRKECQASNHLQTLRTLKEQQAPGAPAAEAGSRGPLAHGSLASGVGSGASISIDDFCTGSKAQLEDIQKRSGINSDIIRELAAIILAGAATVPKDGASADGLEVPRANPQPLPGDQQLPQQQPASAPEEEQQTQDLPKPDFESDRPAPAKRDRTDESEEVGKAGAEDTADAEKEAADHLFGDQDSDRTRQRSRSPKGPPGKKLGPRADDEMDAEDKKAKKAEEEAELAMAFAEEFPDKPTEVSTDIPAAASASAASSGLSG